MILAWQLPALTYWQHAEVKWSFMEVGFSYDIAHKRVSFPVLKVPVHYSTGKFASLVNHPLFLFPW